MPTMHHSQMPQSGQYLPGFFISNEQQSLEMYGAPGMTVVNPQLGRSLSSHQSFSDLSLSQPDHSVVMGDLLAHRTGLRVHNPDLSFLHRSPEHPDSGYFNG